ncbi:MAG: pyruvate kinase [Candidatus Woesearchaeota archaeon]
MKQTKIIATIGPSCEDPHQLQQLIDKGINCARINTAHGDFNEYKKRIDTIRSIKSIPIMIDIKGPELRILMQEDILLQAKEVLHIGFTSKHQRCFNYNFVTQAEIGDIIYFDDGKFVARIVKVYEDAVDVEFENGGLLKPKKGVNIPHKTIHMPALSERDLLSIKFAKDNDAEFIAQSFVRHKQDVQELKVLLSGTNIKIIAKIESQAGIDNIDEILEVADGIMVARGDLGIELPQEKIPFLQKLLIKKCNQAGKISIVATQMLESMIANPIPTRAEVSDVANAVLDGADTVMLSGETAIGKHPVQAVDIMARICKELEHRIRNRIDMTINGDVSVELSKSLYYMVKGASIDKIICITRSGFSASLISRFRLDKKILAVTHDKLVAQQLELVWGVTPVYIEQALTSRPAYTVTKYLVAQGFVKKTDVLAFIGGIATKEPSIINRLEVHQAGDLIEYFDAYVAKK